MQFISKMRPGRLIALAVVLAIILFLALNILARHWGASTRIDVTENRLFTLSEGTKTVVSNLKEPLKFRLFLSSDLVAKAPQLAAFSNRVQEMLNAYTRMSGGKITLEVIDPKPFSDDEDRAVGLGINRFSIGSSPSPLFFGMAATNSTDGKGAIPVFSPEREPNLEYDLTRLVAELGQPGKPKVALIDGLGLSVNPQTRQPAQQITAQMEQFFEIAPLPGDVAELPNNTRVVMVVHPQNLSDTTLFTLDQWVLGGGATMIFVDPYAETQPGPRPGMPAPNPSSNLDKLFKAWGVTFNTEQAIGDPGLALRTMRQIAGRQIEVANHQWLGLRGDALVGDDPVLSELSNVFLTTAGAFDVAKDAEVTLKPLLRGSAQAGTLSARAAGSPQNDPRVLLGTIKRLDKRPVMAARLEGKLKTAFPDGPPKPAEESSKQGQQGTGADSKADTKEDAEKADTTSAIAESSEPLNVMLFGDADMLMDRNWVQRRRLFNQEVVQAFANNGDLILNAVEQMAGGAVLAGLRGREVAWRPFERIAALEQQAESRFLAKEQELVARLRDAETKLRELNKENAGQGELLNENTAKAIEQFRADMLSTRAQLREVQFNLRNDVERLKNWVTGLNVGLIPAVVAILALLFALRRPQRRVPVASQS